MLADDDAARWILGMNAHEPAINQVGDDQTGFMIVAREPRYGINHILQLQQVLPGTIFHLATSVSLDARGADFVSKNLAKSQGS
jgi:hypothetical protein